LPEGLHLLDTNAKPNALSTRKGREEQQVLVIHDNCANRMAITSAGDGSFKFLPHQLSMVGSRPTMVITGDGELGFDSGEGAWRNGYHFQGRQQARKLPNPDTGRQ